MRASFAALFSCLLCDCAEHPEVWVELSRCWPTACATMPGDDGGVSDAGVTRAWGEWASSLAVPSCPDAGVLVVNTLDDTLLDQTLITPSRPTLSLPEAL